MTATPSTSRSLCFVRGPTASRNAPTDAAQGGLRGGTSVSMLSMLKALKPQSTRATPSTAHKKPRAGRAGAGLYAVQAPPRPPERRGEAKSVGGERRRGGLGLLGAGNLGVEAGQRVRRDGEGHGRDADRAVDALAMDAQRERIDAGLAVQHHVAMGVADGGVGVTLAIGDEPAGKGGRGDGSKQDGEKRMTHGNSPRGPTGCRFDTSDVLLRRSVSNENW